MCVWCGAVSRPVCVSSRSMATEHSGLQSVLDVSVDLLQLLLLCTSGRAEEQRGVNIRNRSSGMGTDFPINL